MIVYTWWKMIPKQKLIFTDRRKWQTSDEETLIQSQSAIQVCYLWKGGISPNGGLKVRESLQKISLIQGNGII